MRRFNDATQSLQGLWVLQQKRNHCCWLIAVSTANWLCKPHKIKVLHFWGNLDFFVFSPFGEKAKSFRQLEIQNWIVQQWMVKNRSGSSFYNSGRGYYQTKMASQQTPVWRQVFLYKVWGGTIFRSWRIDIGQSFLYILLFQGDWFELYSKCPYQPHLWGIYGRPPQ